MAMSHHQYIAFNAFVFICIVLLCLTVGAVLKKFRWDRYFPGSAAAIILGFVIGSFFNLSSDSGAAFVFSPEIFFFLLLPPIMIEAGYTLKRKQFFKNFGTIATYAFAGTFVTCIAFGFILYIFAAARLIPLEGNNPIECLIFGALISATDPVAVLAMLNSPEVRVPPTLYALIFGESILNDAIAIVLFNTFKGLIPDLDTETNRPRGTDASQVSFGFVKFLGAVASFLWISVGSTVVGFLVSFICAFITRRFSFRNYPAYEVTLIILFAWLSYFLNEALQLSGIMGIFFTAVGLAHYSYYNISPKAQLATHEAFKSVAQVAETFVFAYIGIAVGMSIKARPLKWDFGMILLSIFTCFVARAFHIFPLTFIANRYRKEKVPINMQIPVWWAGLRGAVAVALSFSFPLGREDDGNMPFVVTSTLGIVLTTTIICGGTTVQVLDACGMNLPRDEALLPGDGGHGDSAGHGVEGHGHEDDDSMQPADGEKYNKAVGRFRKFDRTFMRKWSAKQRQHPLLCAHPLPAYSLCLLAAVCCVGSAATSARRCWRRTRTRSRSSEAGGLLPTVIARLWLEARSTTSSTWRRAASGVHTAGVRSTSPQQQQTCRTTSGRRTQACETAAGRRRPRRCELLLCIPVCCFAACCAAAEARYERPPQSGLWGRMSS